VKKAAAIMATALSNLEDERAKREAPTANPRADSRNPIPATIADGSRLRREEDSSLDRLEAGIVTEARDAGLNAGRQRMIPTPPKEVNRSAVGAARQAPREGGGGA